MCSEYFSQVALLHFISVKAADISVGDLGAETLRRSTNKDALPTFSEGSKLQEEAEPNNQSDRRMKKRTHPETGRTINTPDGGNGSDKQIRRLLAQKLFRDIQDSGIVIATWRM